MIYHSFFIYFFFKYKASDMYGVFPWCNFSPRRDDKKTPDLISWLIKAWHTSRPSKARTAIAGLRPLNARTVLRIATYRNIHTEVQRSNLQSVNKYSVWRYRQNTNTFLSGMRGPASMQTADCLRYVMNLVPVSTFGVELDK